MQFTVFSISVLNSRRLRLLSAIAVFVSMAVGASMAGAGESCEEFAGDSCRYEIEEEELQKVPPFFKFQSRISQAKLPVGDVIFDKVFVNVKSGEAVLCEESFGQVPVRDSVLNLEIGRTMDCELGTIISKNQDLKFQICIGNQENCLKPVSLSSVPYAIKSSYAHMASKAQNANEAVQCHYAHRMTADRSLFTKKEIGVGYYDFHTPDIGYIDQLIDMYDETAMSTPYHYGGFIQWAQVDPMGSNLHICAHYPESTGSTLGRLEELVFHAAKTQSFGQMVVKGDPEYTGAENVLAITKTPTPDRGLIVERGMTASGVGYFNDDVVLRNELNEGVIGSDGNRSLTYYPTHTLEGHGVSNFYSAVNVGQSVYGDDIEDLDTYKGLDLGEGANHVMTVNHWLDVNGISTFNANATFGENVTVSGDNFTTETNTTLTAEGPSHLNGNVTVGKQQAAGSGTMDVYHNTVFHGAVNIGTDGEFVIPDGAIGKGAIGNYELTDDEVLEVLGIRANEEKSEPTGIVGNGSEHGVVGVGGKRGVYGTGYVEGVYGSSSNYGLAGESGNVGVFGAGPIGLMGLRGTYTETTPDTSLDETGRTAAVVGYTDSSDFGVFGEGTSGTGVYGLTDHGTGVTGVSGTGGIGGSFYADFGIAPESPTGVTAGVYSRSVVGPAGYFTNFGAGSSPDDPFVENVAIYARSFRNAAIYASSERSIAIRGISEDGLGGIYGKGHYSHSEGYGVKGEGHNGVWGVTGGDDGYGASLCDSGDCRGVYGQALDGNGVGVYGYAAGNGPGVYGRSNHSSGGRFHHGSTGLPDFTDDANINAGVIGTSNEGPGGYFRGDEGDVYHAPINIGKGPETFKGRREGDFWVYHENYQTGICFRSSSVAHCVEFIHKIDDPDNEDFWDLKYKRMNAN